MNFYLALIAGFMLSALLGWLAWFARSMREWGETKQELEQYEKLIEETQRHADTPATPGDAAAKLRERAAAKRAGPPRH